MLKSSLTGIFILCATISTFAQWPQSATINVPICTANLGQSNPSIVTDGNGGAIIAWQDDRNNALYVYAQHIDAWGKTKWRTNGIAIDSLQGSVALNPIVISDNQGGAFFVWSDTRNASAKDAVTGDTDIYMQHVDSTGAFTWVTINGNSNGLPVCKYSSEKSNLIAIPDGSGGMFVAWNDYRSCLGYKDSTWMINTGSTHFPHWVTYNKEVCEASIQNNAQPLLFLQHVTVNDSLWNSDTVGILSCDTTHKHPQISPQLIADGNGGLWLVWLDNQTQVLCQHYSSTGSLLLAPAGVQVCSSVAAKDSLIAVSDNHGGFIAAWADKRNYSNTGSDIYAQRMNAKGQMVWTAQGIAVVTANLDQFSPQIAADTAGGAYIVWQDRRNYYDPPNYFGIDLYGQHLNATDGSALWTNGGISIISAPQDQYQQTVLADGSNGVYVTWVDNRASGGSNENAYNNPHIYAKHLASDSTILWGGATGWPICTAQSSQDQTVMTLSNGSIMLAWRDLRNSNIGNELSDIYAQWLLPPGESVFTYTGNPINFNAVTLGNADTVAFNAQNSSIPSGVNITKLISSDPHFTPVVNSAAIAFGNTVPVGIEFEPDSNVIATYNGSIQVFNNLISTPDTILVSGKGTGPIFSVNSSSLNFGKVLLNTPSTDSFYVYNNGDQPLMLSSISTPSQSVFSVVGDASVLANGIAANDSALINVKFLPTTAQPYHDRVTLLSNAHPVSDTIGLFAQGVTSAVSETPNSFMFSLDQNYPNPFHSTTALRFTLPSPEKATLFVIDMLGRQVATVTEGVFAQGTHTAEFDGTNLPTGIYTCILQTGQTQITRKIMLVH